MNETDTSVVNHPSAGTTSILTADYWRLITERLTVIGLLLVLLLGVYFRFLGLNWDNNQHLHPDERFLTMVGSAIQPPSLQQYFDTDTSPLNPHNKNFGFFVYGMLPVFVVRYTAGWLDQACAGFLQGVCAWTSYTDYEHIFMVGRVLSALSDLLVIPLLFFIGRRLFDRRVGLLAALLAALSVFPIQQSHFYTVDTMSTLFVVATFYFIVRIADEGRWWDYVLGGILLGMAVASRVNVATLAGIIAVAAGMNVLKVLPRLRRDREFRDLILLRTANLLVVCLLLALVVFRIGQPYSFKGPGFLGIELNPKWLANMEQIASALSGNDGSPPSIQWANRVMYFDPWKNIVLWGLGLPLGLAAWGAWLWAIIRSIRGLRSQRQEDRDEWRRHILVVLWIGGYFFEAARSWSHTMRYFLPIYPFLALMAAWGLVKLWDLARDYQARRTMEGFRPPSFALRPGLAAVTLIVVVVGTFLWAFAFTRIYTRPISRVAASIWIYENIPSVATLLLETPAGPHQYQMVMGPQVNLAINAPNTAQFKLDNPATLTAVRFNYLMAANRDATPRTIRVTLATDPGGTQPIDQAEVTEVMNTGPDERGRAYDFVFPHRPTLGADITYYLVTQVMSGGPVVASTSIIAGETSWDDWLPRPLEGRDGNLMYQDVNLDLYAEEDPPKRENMLKLLDQADYIFISSQRVMWSVVRIPQRWPMTIAYYEKLFNGDLGFDLVRVSHSLPNLGPLIISDISAQLAWGQPPVIGPYVSELGADEAFSVYDHPPVWIFQKNPRRYSHDNVRAFLYSFDPAKVVKTSPFEASKSNKLSTQVLQIVYSLFDPARNVQLWQHNVAATALLQDRNLRTLSTEQLAQQLGSAATLLEDESLRQQNEAGGTWARMFSWDSLLVRFEPLAVIAWWLTVLILGWLAFPLVFVAMRGLADRGYAFTKTLALLLVAYGAWLGGSLRLLPFTRSTLLLMVLLLGAAAALIVHRRRDELVAFVRSQQRHLLLVEGLTFALFLFFIMVRVGNPELWHPSFGGEKPMDFAYFNAILKTTWFPPYDPWFAGGYINYYYFGFVIVAVITKLLGLVPAYAYNLILPMLFALTGMGGFGVAYNLVAGIQRYRAGQQAPAALLDRPLPAGRWPYIAGVLAVLLVVVLGNLGEIDLIVEKGFLVLAPAGDSAPCTFKSTIPGLKSLVCDVAPTVGRIGRGIGRALGGQSLPIATNWWYWNATRVIPPGEGEAGPINEFPYFTFLYADLHAHMIAMPLTLLALGLALAWVQGRRRTAGDSGPGAVGSNPTRRPPAPTGEGLGERPDRATAEDGAGEASTPAPDLQWATVTSEAEATPVAAVAGPAVSAPPALPPLLTGERPARPLARSNWWATLREQLRLGWPEALTLGLLALVVGALWPTNTWDYPTYLSVAVMAILLGEIEVEGRITLAALGRWLALAAAMGSLSYIVFLPYREAFATAYTGFELWQGSKTPLWAYLILNGVFLFILVSWMVNEVVGWLRGRFPLTSANLARLRSWSGVIVGGLVILAAGFLILRGSHFWVPVAPLALPLVVVAALLTLRPGIEAERRAVGALVTLSLTLTYVVEVIVLKGDISRMNTVFKFYLQVWIMLGVASAVALAWLLADWRTWLPVLRRAWGVALGLLLFCAALYPVYATKAKWEDRFAPETIPPTLNGMAYMQGAQYDEGHGGPFKLIGDYLAIRWLQENVQGSPVIMEASSGNPGPNVPLYHYGNRVSINTGLPAVMGWDWHQKQQRSATPGEWIDQRQQQVHDFYSTTDPQQALAILRRYHVRYVYVGPEEQVTYGPQGLAKFDRMPELRLVYPLPPDQNPQVKIYEVLLPAE